MTKTTEIVNPIVVKNEDFAQTRKRLKHALEFAKLNPKNVLDTKTSEYISITSQELINAIDDMRVAKVPFFQVERKSYAPLFEQVIADQPYSNLTQQLEVAKRKQHNDAYRSKMKK
jgi:hypothetical protein